MAEKADLSPDRGRSLSVARIVLGAGTLSLLLLVLFRETALEGATDWLYDSDPPATSDLLVVLGGGNQERLQTALDLYRDGMAPTIMITDGCAWADTGMRFLEDSGVPHRALLAPPRPSESTWQDALSIRQAVQEQGFGSVLVVTSPYHCRRTRLMLVRALAGLGTTVRVTPSVSLYMDSGRWWRSRQGWITVPWEFPKLLWAWITVPTVPAVGAAGAGNQAQVLDLPVDSPYIEATVLMRIPPEAASIKDPARSGGGRAVELGVCR